MICRTRFQGNFIRFVFWLSDCVMLESELCESRNLSIKDFAICGLGLSPDLTKTADFVYRLYFGKSELCDKGKGQCVPTKKSVRTSTEKLEILLKFTSGFES